MNYIDKWNENLFFADFWGKKPCVIKNFISESNCQKFCPNELSGLALEEDLVSRIICYEQASPETMTVDHGPFSESHLSQLPTDRPWSLLIQDAEKKTDLFDDILNKFKSIPREFLDDVMVSIGNLNSGTGPHLDWYNVFILQTGGEKNWKVEKNKRTFEEHDSSILPDMEVKILKNLNSYYEHDLRPGEMLYIPPGHGHHGTSTAELSMSLSIGFQGPRLVTLIETYLSKLIGKIHEDQRVDFSPTSDAKLNLDAWPKEIPVKDTEMLSNLIKLAKEQDY